MHSVRRTAGGYLAYSGRWSVQRTAEREEQAAGRNRRQEGAGGRKEEGSGGRKEEMAGRKVAGSSRQ